MRPADISQDLSTDLEVFQHALSYLAEQESYVPDIVVHLRPTTPVRNVEDIDRMIMMLGNTPDSDCVRAIFKLKDTPFKMWFKGDDNKIVPVVSDKHFPEAYNMPRQALPQAYMQTASIDVIRATTILKKIQ